jgi:hypothetical protein
MAKSVIELNGQIYDTSTGKLLSSAQAKQTHSKTTPVKASTSTVKHLDGFSRRPNASKRATHAVATAKVHARPQKSQTLMRTAVKKPVAPAKIHAKTPATTAVTSKRPPIAANAFMATVKPGRAIRATHTPKSNLISKFGSAASAIKTEVLTVKPEPAQSATAAHQAIPAKTASVINHPKQTVAQADPFQSALEQAISHEQPKTKKKKLHHRVAKKLHVSPRVVSLASFVIVGVAISSFIAYQNLPEIAMRVAATRAGLSASLPSYQPSGFALAGPIQYKPGEVTINYKTHSDDRGFNVVQKNSSWNSETLLDNFVSATNKPYQTFQSNGRTIYIYDGNKATWVDGGIWYSIDGQSNLNSDQLLRIAASL